MKLCLGRVPHGGWAFPVAEGVTLTAINQEILTKRIYEYRIRNNLPIGDIEREVNDHYCKNWPEGCVKEAHELGGPRVEFPHSERIGNRVARWASGLLHSMPQGGHKLVSQPEAISRAKVCMNCAKNVPWKGGCGGCSRSAVTVLAQLRKVQRTPHDGQLMACAVTGWGNETAIWLGEGNLPVTQEQRDALHPKCWRRELP